MANKILYLLMFYYVGVTTFAQHISVDKSCMEINSVILAQSFIELKGEKYVSKLLDANISFLIFCTVDSLGHVDKINKITSKKRLDRKFISKIESKLRIDSVSFFLCYEKPPGFDEKDVLNKLKRDLSTANRTEYLMNVGFPGYLMSLYNYEKDKKMSQNITLSKFQYLKLQIEKYQNR
ncbi:MAG: hypothetical protein QM786_17930 [Breznakibacter sp.]